VIYSIKRFCTLDSLKKLWKDLDMIETQVNHTDHAFMKSNYSTSTVVAVFSDGKSQRVQLNELDNDEKDQLKKYLKNSEKSYRAGFHLYTLFTKRDPGEHNW